MRKTLVLLAVLAAATYILGERARRPAAKQQHTLLQRAALLWTSPRLAPVRRAVRRRTSGH